MLKKYENLEGIINFDEINKFRKFMMMYNCAIKEVRTKFEILNDDLSLDYDRNPIEMIKSRVKSPESIISKIKRKGFESNVDSILENINDIAGVRVICSFVDDIYKVAEMFISQDDIKVIKIKDYIKNPKPNGYRSLHFIVSVPIFLAQEKRIMKVEIQLRTIAMDFWASLEHQLHYKKNFEFTDGMKQELLECATMSAELDSRMDALRDKALGSDRDIQ
jgi:putative GTP pyrophosphokinase